MRQTAVAFYCKELLLEGILASPQGLPGPFPGVLLCHAHPLFGGNMEEPVVVAMNQALVNAGFMCLRFNFRGVGGSEGQQAKGEAEVADVEAGLEFLYKWQTIDRQRLAVAGYSFGASVTLLGLGSLKHAKAFAFVSPTATSIEKAGLAREKRPKLFLVGQQDKLIPPQKVEEALTKAAQPVEMAIAGADHSWRGHQPEVGERVTAFLTKQFGMVGSK